MAQTVHRPFLWSRPLLLPRSIGSIRHLILQAICILQVICPLRCPCRCGFGLCVAGGMHKGLSRARASVLLTRFSACSAAFHNLSGLRAHSGESMGSAVNADSTPLLRVQSCVMS
jgi:hypothetical protein